MKKFLNKKIINLINIFKENNFKCYVVGGAIRDILLNRAVYDFDLCTDAHPNEIKRLFKKHIDIGEKFGCVKVLFKDEWFEITTLRIENDYEDFRHANYIEFVDSPYLDSLRRDFTINSIYYDLHNFIDPLNGILDIDKKLLKAIGDKNLKFREDPLRILRCIRFKSQLSFKIEIETLLSLKNNFHLIGNLSKYRIHEELSKIFKGENSRECILLLLSLNLFKVIMGFNVKFFNINHIFSHINEFHIKLFCLLYFHSSIHKDEILNIIKDHFNFNKLEMKDLYNIQKSVSNFKNTNLFIKELIFKFDYDFTYKIILILSHYIHKDLITKFIKIKWSFSPLKFSHINYNIIPHVKDKKNVTKYRKYLITLLFINPHLNNERKLKHLIKGFKL